jgi:hypothetical protein
MKYSTLSFVRLQTKERGNSHNNAEKLHDVLVIKFYVIFCGAFSTFNFIPGKSSLIGRPVFLHTESDKYANEPTNGYGKYANSFSIPSPIILFPLSLSWPYNNEYYDDDGMTCLLITLIIVLQPTLHWTKDHF